MNLDMHCGRAGCLCTHTHGCECGWIWTEYVDEKIIKRNNSGARDVIRQTYQGVYPCPVCDPERHSLYLNSKSHEEYTEALRNRGTFKKKKAYEDNERSETRTL